MRVLGLIAFSEFVRRFEAATMKLGDALEKLLTDPEKYPRSTKILRRRELTETIKRLRAWKDGTSGAGEPQVPGAVESDLINLEAGVREMEEGVDGISTGTAILIVAGVIVAGVVITFLSGMASSAGAGVGTRIVEPRIIVDKVRKKSV